MRGELGDGLAAFFCFASLELYRLRGRRKSATFPRREHRCACSLALLRPEQAHCVAFLPRGTWKKRIRQQRRGKPNGSLSSSPPWLPRPRLSSLSPSLNDDFSPFLRAPSLLLTNHTITPSRSAPRPSSPRSSPPPSPTRPSRPSPPPPSPSQSASRRRRPLPTSRASPRARSPSRTPRARRRRSRPSRRGSSRCAVVVVEMRWEEIG